MALYNRDLPAVRKDPHWKCEVKEKQINKMTKASNGKPFINQGPKLHPKPTYLSQSTNSAIKSGYWWILVQKKTTVIQCLAAGTTWLTGHERGLCVPVAAHVPQVLHSWMRLYRKEYAVKKNQHEQSLWWKEVWCFQETRRLICFTNDGTRQ